MSNLPVSIATRQNEQKILNLSRATIYERKLGVVAAGLILICDRPFGVTKLQNNVLNILQY
jgi:hypothetical protein